MKSGRRSPPERPRWRWLTGCSTSRDITVVARAREPAARQHSIGRQPCWSRPVAVSRRSSCPTLRGVADANQETDYELHRRGRRRTTRAVRLAGRRSAAPGRARTAPREGRVAGRGPSFRARSRLVGPAASAGPWTIRLDAVTLELRPTDAGQVGVFPEHDEMRPWLLDRAASTVLNLFAYTGLLTL